MSEFNFAQTLKGLIKERKIKIKDLAAVLDISKQAISDYCTGKTTPKYPVLIKLADFLGVSCDFLLTGFNHDESSANKELGLSGSAIRRLKDCKPELLDFINAMLADSDFYAAVDRLYDNLNNFSLNTAAQIQAMSNNGNSAAQYKEVFNKLGELTYIFNIELDALKDLYFRNFARRNTKVKETEKLIQDKLKVLINQSEHAAPSDAQA